MKQCAYQPSIQAGPVNDDVSFAIAAVPGHLGVVSADVLSHAHANVIGICAVTNILIGTVPIYIL